MRAWLLLGCGPDPDEAAVAPRSALTCEVQPDNTLRADCTLASGEILQLTYTDPQGEARTVPGDGDSSLTLWGLLPDTAYEVVARSAGGERQSRFTSGAVPEALAALEVELEGESAELEGVLQSVLCDGAWFFVGLDVSGRLRWYHPLLSEDGPRGGIGGYSLVPGPGLLALVGMGVWEWDMLGRPGVAIDEDLPRPVHHDVARAGEHTLVLFVEPVTGPDGYTYLLDGVYAFHADGTLAAEWHLADHVDPASLQPGVGTGSFWPQYPDAVDWSHANSVTVTDDGDWLVSFRWLDAVFRIDGQIGAPSFGEVEWVLVGDERSPLASSFALQADPGLVPGFVGQHHATQRGDRLWLFDNRLPPEPSRAIELVLEGDEARTVASHSVGEPCEVEGGVVPLPAGGVLATCATSGVASEFTATSGDDAVFTLRAACPAAGGPGRMGGAPRVLPLDLP
jgi:hypothetical protein